ncbi:MAG: T9SS type A sorting domain-containing protein [Nanoarchaeota archaeon]
MTTQYNPKRIITLDDAALIRSAKGHVGNPGLYTNPKSGIIAVADKPPSDVTPEYETPSTPEEEVLQAEWRRLTGNPEARVNFHNQQLDVEERKGVSHIEGYDPEIQEEKTESEKAVTVNALNRIMNYVKQQVGSDAFEKNSPIAAGVGAAGVYFLLSGGINKAEATTFYVEAGITTIQEAVDGASSGDSVKVGHGTYTGFDVMNKKLTIYSEEGPDNTHIVATGPDQTQWLVAIGYADSTKLEGFTFNGQSYVDGAVVYVIESPATIDNSVIRGGNHGYRSTGAHFAEINDSYLSGWLRAFVSHDDTLKVRNVTLGQEAEPATGRLLQDFSFWGAADQHGNVDAENINYEQGIQNGENSMQNVYFVSNFSPNMQLANHGSMVNYLPEQAAEIEWVMENIPPSEWGAYPLSWLNESSGEIWPFPMDPSSVQDISNSYKQVLRIGNPAHYGKLHLFDLDPMKRTAIEIYDANGRQQAQTQTQGLENLVWQVGELPSGILFIKAMTEGEVRTGKVINLK